jgi:amino acid transporter
MRVARVKASVPDAMRDPGVQALVVLALLALAGFVMLGLAWHGAARTIYVPLQSPWLVSGGVAGLALLGMALGAWSIHEGRRRDAEHRAVMEDIVREAAELAEDVRSGRRRLPRR